jgi:hypothetical protein
MQKFRWWLHNLWVDNCEERRLAGQEPLNDVRTYWLKYRSWLLTEYRTQRKIEKERNELKQRHARWS